MPRVHELSCSWCGARNELDEEERKELEAVSLRVWANEQSERSLAAKQTKVLLSSGKHRKRLFVLMGVAALPWMCLASFLLMPGAVPADSGDAFVILTLTLLPMVLMFALVALTVRWHGQRRALLLSACSARPPEVPGEPSSCRFCRAPLVARGSEGVVRCEHCDTDNVVSAAVAQRARARHREATSELRSRVKLSSQDLQSAIQAMRVRIYLSVVLIPLATLGLLFSVLFVGFLFEQPPDATREYAVVKTGEGPCIGWITGGGDAEMLSFGFASTDGHVDAAPLSQFEVLERTTIDGLLGRRVKVEGKIGRLDRAFSTPLATNWVEVRFPERPDEKWSDSIMGVCLAP